MMDAPEFELFLLGHRGPFACTIRNAAICSTRDARKVSPEKISSLAGTLSMGTNPQFASLQTLSVSGDRWGSSRDTRRMSRESGMQGLRNPDARAARDLDQIEFPQQCVLCTRSQARRQAPPHFDWVEGGGADRRTSRYDQRKGRARRYYGQDQAHQTLEGGAPEGPARAQEAGSNIAKVDRG